MVRRIALLGGESTGKTSLARALAAALGEPWVAEFGRELTIDKSVKGGLVYDDLLAIGTEQCEREDHAAVSARHWLICDTSPLTTLFYSLAMFERADPALVALADRTYDLTFLCSSDFDFVQDGWREDTAFRDQQQQWYRDELAKRTVEYNLLSGNHDQRLENALGIIAAAGGR